MCRTMLAMRNIIPILIRKNIKTLRKFSSASHILNSGLADVTVPSGTVPEYIFEKCETFERFTALECGISGRKYTYKDVMEKSKNFSRAVRKKLGLRERSVVAIFLPNIPEFAISALGILHGNLIVTTLNPLYTPDEICRQLTDSSAQAIVTIPHLHNAARTACKLLKKDLPIITVRLEAAESLPQKAIDFFELVNTAIDYPDPSPDKSEDVGFLPYSSGTTGLPKGVQLTHQNLLANVAQNNCPEIEFFHKTTDSHQDVVPCILPMFHIYGFTVNTLLPLSNGTKIITLPKFVPEDYVNVLRKHRPDILFVAPPLVLFLAGSSMVKQEDFDSVRVVVSGAASLGALDEQRLIDKAGKHLYVLQGYGLTESSPVVSVISIPFKEKFKVGGSIGHPLPNTLIKVIAIDDPTGTPLGPNCQGELLVKGPQVMKGYLNKPEETEKTFLDGWLRTGDIVYYNNDGLIFVTDRLKELIKVKGFQVAPAELEEIIRSFKNVQDAAVIGVPHESQGEAPRAYVVGKKGCGVNVQELVEYVNNKVAYYKQLKGGVAVVDSIPKNPAGKILRRTLKLEFENAVRRQ